MIVTDPADLTAEWISTVLGRPVDGVRCEQVGTGQIGACYRLTLTGQGVPDSVLVKLPAADSGARELLAGAYRGEVRFYADLARTVAIRVPDCHLAEISAAGGEFTLVMADLAPAVQGDQLAGCSPGQARDAVVNLAGLHGPRWCDPTLADVPELNLNGPEDAAQLAEFLAPATDIFVDALGDRLAPVTVETVRAVAAGIESWALGRAERFGLVHGDYRLDNLLFGPDDAPGVVAVDWQTLSLALPARDLAYFTGTSLTVDDRRAHEDDLVDAYHAALLGHGVTGYDRETCWDDYRFAMFQGPLVAVFGLAYGTRTDRGDAMFAVMVERSCTAIRDLDTFALVP